MANYQRYSSQELIHFIGGLVNNGKSDEARFEILVDHILPQNKSSTGLLQADLNNRDTVFSVRLHKLGEDRLGELAEVKCICFCDITEENLQVHKAKYGKVGLSFTKEFLVGRGANPMFYVEKNSFSHHSPDVKHQVSFGKNRDMLSPLFVELNDLSADSILLSHYAPVPSESDTKEERELKKEHVQKVEAFAERLQRLYSPMRDFSVFLLTHFYPFVKMFDSGQDEAAIDNYYMEREWRVTGSVEFTLEDIHRVFLPKRFIAPFRKKYPNYMGQITFSD